MKYSDKQRIGRILDNGTKLLKYIKDHQITKAQLMDSYALQWTVTTPLYNIGEHVYHLTKAFKNRYPDIEWAMIAGLRHRLVHDYDGTNWEIISDVLFEELPILIEELKKIYEEI